MQFPYGKAFSKKYSDSKRVTANDLCSGMFIFRSIFSENYFVTILP